MRPSSELRRYISDVEARAAGALVCEVVPGIRNSSHLAIGWGELLPAPAPLRPGAANSAESWEARCSVLVFCPWRLMGRPGGEIAASAFQSFVDWDAQVSKVETLLGAKIVAAKLDPELPTQSLQFDDGRVLEFWRVFESTQPPDSSDYLVTDVALDPRTVGNDPGFCSAAFAAAPRAGRGHTPFHELLGAQLTRVEAELDRLRVHLRRPHASDIVFDIWCAWRVLRVAQRDAAGAVSDHGRSVEIVAGAWFWQSAAFELPQLHGRRVLRATMSARRDAHIELEGGYVVQGFAQFSDGDYELSSVV